MFLIKKIAFTYDNLKKILIWENFKDARFSQNWNLIIESNSWEKIYYLVWFDFNKFFEYILKLTEKVKFKSFKKDKNWRIRDFSFHIPLRLKNWEIFYQWFRWIFKISVSWEEITLRKLVWPVNLSNIIKDEKFLDIVLKWFISRKSFIISWRPWSWKSTILISSLEFFNKNTYNTFILNILLKNLIWIILWEIKLSNNNKKLEKYILNEFWWNKELLIDNITKLFNLFKEYYFELAKLKKVYTIDIIIEEIKLILNQKKKISWLNIDYSSEIIKFLITFFFSLDKKTEYQEILEDKVLEEIQWNWLLWKLYLFNKIWLKNINTLEAPVEYIYQNKYLRFYQHDVNVHFNWN